MKNNRSKFPFNLSSKTQVKTCPTKDVNRKLERPLRLVPKLGSSREWEAERGKGLRLFSRVHTSSSTSQYSVYTLYLRPTSYHGSAHRGLWKALFSFRLMTRRFTKTLFDCDQVGQQYFIKNEWTLSGVTNHCTI